MFCVEKRDVCYGYILDAREDIVSAAFLLAGDDYLHLLQYFLIGDKFSELIVEFFCIHKWVLVGMLIGSAFGGTRLGVLSALCPEAECPPDFLGGFTNPV